MKKDDRYRFCLQFNMGTEEEIRAGELLERLGRRKSAVVIAAINEYITNHPDLSADELSRKVRVSTITLDQLEKRIRQVVDEKLSEMDVPNHHSTTAERNMDKISQDVLGVLDDLVLFG